MGTFNKIPMMLVLSLAALASSAQETYKQVNKRLDASQKSFAKMLGDAQMDKDGKALLNRFVTTEIDSLQKIVKDDNDIPNEMKIQAINCQCYLLDTLKAQVARKNFDIGLLRDSRDNFIPLWKTMVLQQPNDEAMKEFDPNSANLMAVVFRDFPQAGRIRDMATLKRLEEAPENIMIFLDKNPVFELRDSLIFIAANTVPEKLVFFIANSRNDELQKAIHQNTSPLVQALVSVAAERNLKNYLPFMLQIAEKKMTLAEIDKLRTQPVQYYQAMVDAAIANQGARQAGATPLYVKPTHQYLKEYGIMFYTDLINSMHDEPNEKIRFESLNDLRPQDLYYIITNGETELYTSSYLYTYKKLMKSFEKSTSDAIFDLVKYDQFRKFLLMAGRYNTISAFMSQMPREKSIAIVKKLMGGLEEHSSNGLEQTINVAETFPGIVKDLNLAALTSQEIKNNYNRCQAVPNLYGMKIYKLLSEIYKAVRSGQTDNGKTLPPELMVYFSIPHQSLREANGNITQLVLFYGDDDGKASYGSFMTNFTDGSQWSIEKNSSWVTIKSKKLYPITIYANLPLSNDDGLDVKAQDTLNQYLAAHQITPHILIHRGHSYHLPNSINYVNADTRLAIIGSCGGYREIFEILDKSKDAQIISTKQIGSLQVNEPILKLMNERLLNQKDIDWADMWTVLEKQFKNNRQAYDYFQEYVPPYKNIALLVATLYNQSGLE
jgi:hypothetical protein